MMPTELNQSEIELFAHQAECYIAQKDFWDYCIAVDNDFYKEEWDHLHILCSVLDNLYHKKLISPSGKPYTKLRISIPPQHGKTRTLVHFCEWMLGKNNEERIITASYNDGTASDFSRYVRDGIQVEKNLEEDIVFRDVFPNTRIKQGHSGFEKWALSGQHFNYMGAGIGGSITSKGATVLIVDDPVKGAIEAYSSNYLNKCWDWYTGTFISRVAADKGEPLEIIVMTRWSTDDIVGRIISDPFIRDEWYHLEMEAYDSETDKMLCPDLLGKKRYEYLQTVMPRAIFLANYHQKPLEFEGALYKDFKTYKEIPKDEQGRQLFEGIYSYTDTADTGNDYLCTIIYGLYLGLAYILDVIYSDKAMEVTEPLVADKLFEHSSGFNKIESNNGGRGFARNVARIYFERYEVRLQMKWFHQSENKLARIFSNSARVIEICLMPHDWHNRWPIFFKDIMSYTKEGKNEHDDGPDTLTGIVEGMDKKVKARTFKNVM